MKDFIIILFFFFIAACTPAPIDINIQEEKPKLVISSQIVPHQTIFVSVTRSFSALAKAGDDKSVYSSFLNSILVKDAFVTVGYFGKTDTLHMVTPGIYSSNNVLQYEYGTYNLYVRDKSTGTVVTSSTVLNPLVLFDTISVTVNKTQPDTSVVVDFSFTDVKGVDNWYVVNYYVKQKDIDTSNLDIVSYFKRGTNKLSEFQLFSDKLAVGGHVTNKRRLNGVKADDVIAVTISNISEGYYKFLATYLKSGNIINQISGEPITYPSNVAGGYGFFSAHHPDVRIFDLSTLKKH